MSKMLTDETMAWFAHAFRWGLIPSENVWVIISWISFFFVSLSPSPMARFLLAWSFWSLG